MYRERGILEIPVDLREGDEVDALEFALSANRAHGLQRSAADTTRCVNALMTTLALLDKYPTDVARAKLLGISERKWRDLKAEWAQKDEGTKEERKAKAATRKKAEKYTNNKKPKEEPKPKKEKSAPAPKADKSPRPATTICHSCSPSMNAPRGKRDASSRPIVDWPDACTPITRTARGCRSTCAASREPGTRWLT
jgi:hypothetical protein